MPVWSKATVPFIDFVNLENRLDRIKADDRGLLTTPR
ncbi:hypothetical protein M2351_005235 [Azospirillum canadense]|nr:hypothetical protein [Azospirillum canadense]